MHVQQGVEDLTSIHEWRRAMQASDEAKGEKIGIRRVFTVLHRAAERVRGGGSGGSCSVFDGLGFCFWQQRKMRHQRALRAMPTLPSRRVAVGMATNKPMRASRDLWLARQSTAEPAGGLFRRRREAVQRGADEHEQGADPVESRPRIVGKVPDREEQREKFAQRDHKRARQRARRIG